MEEKLYVSLLESLCSADGVAGMQGIVETAKSLLEPYTDEVFTDAMGNVLAVRHSKVPNAPTVMLEAHLDEIGFLVTHIDSEGFVYVAGAGGIDGRVLTAQNVVVHGEQDYCGVFCSTPPHLSGKDGELPELSKRGIDVGLTAEEAKQHIPLGSRVSFSCNFTKLNGTRICSKSLDDRAGMAAIIACLHQLDDTCPMNVAVAFCVQEELGCRGSDPAARRLRPDCAIVTDVSFALTPDADPNKCGKMGEGVMIGLSPILDGGMSDVLVALAKEQEIPYQYEIMGGGTGTDADHISSCSTGIPTALLSIPQKYMHTPVEVVDLRDIKAVSDLMVAYIRKGGKA